MRYLSLSYLPFVMCPFCEQVAFSLPFTIFGVLPQCLLRETPQRNSPENSAKNMCLTSSCRYILNKEGKNHGCCRSTSPCASTSAPQSTSTSSPDVHPLSWLFLHVPFHVHQHARLDLQLHRLQCLWLFQQLHQHPFAHVLLHRHLHLHIHVPGHLHVHQHKYTHLRMSISMTASASIATNLHLFFLEKHLHVGSWFTTRGLEQCR